MGKTRNKEREMDRDISAPIHLSRRIQHIFDKNPVASGRIIYKDMGHRSDEFSILNNWAAAHE